MQQLEILADRLDASVEALPEIRRTVLEKAGQQLLPAVQSRIGGTGKVQTWQEMHMGSRGGYAAVRPRAKAFYKGHAVGKITNAIEGGHKTRGGGSRVPGKYMYLRSQVDAVRLTTSAGEEITRLLTEKLEG